MMKRNINVINARNRLIFYVISNDTREFTREIDHTHVMSAAKLLSIHGNCKFTREFTREKGHINVKYAIKALLE